MTPRRWLPLLLLAVLPGCGDGGGTAPAPAIPAGTWHLVAVGPLAPPVFVRRVQYLGPAGAPETWRWTLTAMRLRIGTTTTVVVERDFVRHNESTGAQVDSSATATVRAEGLRLCAGGCRALSLVGDTLRVPFEPVPELGAETPPYTFVRR